MNLVTKLKPFDELSVHELYGILKLRNQVFCVEQNCVYNDLDDKDQKSLHLMQYIDNKLVAYSRLLPEGVSYKGYASIGRVVNMPEYRGTGLGKRLMQMSIDKCMDQFPDSPIMIGAQSYLIEFYSSFGFVPEPDDYDEDGIPHRIMVLKY
jgi:ElaA protein